MVKEQSRITLSVVVMAYNEQDNLPHLLSALSGYLTSHPRVSDWEAIVVDDGSVDDTAAATETFAAGEPRVKLLRHGRNEGMGAAIRTGYNAAAMDFVTQLPADFQVPPETFELFWPHVPQHDIVLSVYEDRGERPVRRLLAWGYRQVARLILGQRADYTGTMMFRRTLLDGVTLGANSFVANLEFPLKALNRGASSHVVTFVPSPRLSGTSKVANTRRIAYVFGELLALRRRGL